MAPHSTGELSSADSEMDDDLLKDVGLMFMMGFEGTTVTPQIKNLIEQHHLGTVMLTAKNLISAEQATQLVLDLQTTARNSGHDQPLLIAIDQENGGVNSIFDDAYIQQFPSAMGVAATASPEIAEQIGMATAQEVSAVGVNWLLGPVLDVSNPKNQPLGVRTMGDDPDEVARYAVSFMKGYWNGGVALCGKHFPSYGNLEFLGSPADVPVVSETLEQLQLGPFVPFRKAIAAGLDAMMVGGCAMSSIGTTVMHACLSERVVTHLLRQSLGFDGVVVSECLEMEALYENIGVGQGTVMGVTAGCDVFIVCRSFAIQQEAIAGIKAGIESGVVSRESIARSAKRVRKLISKATDWQRALHPVGIHGLQAMQSSHRQLSSRAYDSTMTVVRDNANLLPLSNILNAEDELLLLSPLVKPFPTSAAAFKEGIASYEDPGSPHLQRHSALPGFTAPAETLRKSLLAGEDIFHDFGLALARRRGGRVLHTSYTANGVRPQHEKLIERASAVIVLTADAGRNHYQYGFAKHVAILCKGKPFILAAISSPYDFALDESIGTYICTYDFTNMALNALVRLLYGDLMPTGVFPSAVAKRKPSAMDEKSTKPRASWLVDNFDETRDLQALDNLLATVYQNIKAQEEYSLFALNGRHFLLRDPELVEEKHFVVRNSSTRALYGFCATYHLKKAGVGFLGAIFVDPQRRSLHIGYSLHSRAMKHLISRKEIKRIQLGSRIPAIFLGIPSGTESGAMLKKWFYNLGWDTSSMSFSTISNTTFYVPYLASWEPSLPIHSILQSSGISFEMLPAGQQSIQQILDHLRLCNIYPGEEPMASLTMVHYMRALAESHAQTARVFVAKDLATGAIIGSVIGYTEQSKVAALVPTLSVLSAALRSENGQNGTGLLTVGITTPIVSTAYNSISSGLALGAVDIDAGFTSPATPSMWATIIVGLCCVAADTYKMGAACGPCYLDLGPHGRSRWWNVENLLENTGWRPFKKFDEVTFDVVGTAKWK